MDSICESELTEDSAELLIAFVIVVVVGAPYAAYGINGLRK